MPPGFPELPIVTPDPPRKSRAEKYGAVYYLGIAGLVIVVGLVAWFGHGVWSLRSVWAEVYRLSDPERPEVERVNAALALSRDPRVTQRQRWDLALNRDLPDLARFVLAESLTSEAVEADPRAFAVAVARSEGWPDWLRLQLLRPLAYAAGEGTTIPALPLEGLRRHSDPSIALWATYALAVATPEAGGFLEALEARAAGATPEAELAGLLLRAARSTQPERAAWLDRATSWVRTRQPAAARVWEGWEEREGHLTRPTAPELRAR